ncbi:tRNA pseudouridine(55) synthase TruB [Variovorax dokdonensis]|uniref:tRNA pseudouridine synthase B n=1 Tax=Variovorax dokdonensis TaxID=344883 RepID=A0ABT7NH39_9BURK|nr:tRNA pseudouridine(55) synthase TruB [Variovorax dokdonensis]MDM0047267.1 tRNA pseudouridine(55) synthase TruB [Variovorax dokdonensis]
MNAPRTRVQRRPVHGVLLLDKPIGLSSNQALQKAKWLLRADKAGHTGTLDPLATGVLPLCFGAATKFSQLHLDADKRYVATARLGERTSTADAEGEVVERRHVDVKPTDLQRVTAQFSGPISQLPPMHSALKKDGKALYEYAREGIEVERAPRDVVVHALSVQAEPDFDAMPTIRIDARVSKGTYIRTLGEDIGNALGCGAHLRSLRRIETGDFSAEACISLETLEAMDEQERLAQLMPVEALVANHETVTLEAEDAGRFLSGLRRRGPWPDMPHVAVFGHTPKAFLGTAHVKGGELIPVRLLSPVEIQQILQQFNATSARTTS